MVAADRDDCAATLEERREDTLDVADGTAGLVSVPPLEDITCDQHDVYPILLEIAGDLFERAADVGTTVHVTKPIAHVPIGRVQDLHGSLPPIHQ